ncbi:head-tail adaptor protein [Sagittula sp. MA-2]|jgi:head-tail adaptor|uniref:phage head completion protein n=1 Tax=Sagittula sp. MA-2 TaxID=3048007 RepID=UPI0024C3D303|nr:head-tail adaptor protein [Sagittula sp. MA-2]WHZ35753.1 head-tail adaptor protein [Sagittula sp. MA-2]
MAITDRKTHGGALVERVAFDAYTQTRTSTGGFTQTWEEQFTTRAQFVYAGGGEAVVSARLAGQSVFKVKVRSSEATRAITSEYRMRDTRRDKTYNVREADPVTDRQWVWLLVESGVAV